MVQIYIKYTDNNYYLLDLSPKEAINFKLTVKDLNDITKVFSPFTQSFKLEATDKNKMLCGFVGNERIQRINNDGVFDALVYVGGFLFQSGKLSFDETDYDFKEQKEFKTVFSSTLTGLAEKLGTLTIQDVFKDVNGDYDPAVIITWQESTQRTRMQNVGLNTMANGIDVRYAIPFITTKRVWRFDTDNYALIDNIAYNIGSPVKLPTNHIQLKEVRPCISWITIMEQIIWKLGLNVLCPIFSEAHVRDLYAWCSAKELGEGSLNYETLDGYYEPILDLITNTVGAFVWPLTSDLHMDYISDGFFKLTRTFSGGVDNPYFWGKFAINITFVGFTNLSGDDSIINLRIVKPDGTIITQAKLENVGEYKFQGNYNLLTNDELDFKIEISCGSLLRWDYVQVVLGQLWVKGDEGSETGRAVYTQTTASLSQASVFGGDKLNLITSLPKMKCTDFIKSFFKMYNIMVVDAGKNDQSMYWLTPDNLKEYNKEYSTRIVDYTQYTDTASLSKKRGNNYNQYIFSHKESKYFDAVYGNGVKFGELTYPTTPPAKATKFEVKTDYSIIKQNGIISHPNGAVACLGFTKDTPEIDDNGSAIYTAVYDEFTIFYLTPRPLITTFIAIEGNALVNSVIQQVQEANFVHSSGKILSFGAENTYTDSLYLNYYDDFIELLLHPNTYASEFNLVLPPSEIFLNFANLAQGQSNIPTGFRAQNQIIIGEQRYQLVDSKIDLTTGKTKLTLLNF